MTTPELIQFINNNLSQGSSTQEIKKQLLSQGWRETDIDEAFQQDVSKIPQNTTTQTQPRSKKVGILALVLGLLGFIAWIIPFIGIVLGISGIVIGIISIRKSSLVLGIIAIILSTICIVLSVLFLPTFLKVTNYLNWYSPTNSSSNNTPSYSTQTIPTNYFKSLPKGVIFDIPQLVGKNKNEIIALLGPNSTNDHYLSYKNDKYNLGINFGSTDEFISMEIGVYPINPEEKVAKAQALEELNLDIFSKEYKVFLIGQTKDPGDSVHYVDVYLPNSSDYLLLKDEVLIK